MNSAYAALTCTKTRHEPFNNLRIDKIYTQRTSTNIYDTLHIETPDFLRAHASQGKSHLRPLAKDGDQGVMAVINMGEDRGYGDVYQKLVQATP